MSEQEARAQQLKAVSDLGVQALARPEFAVLADRAVELITEALQVQIAVVDELQADGDLVVQAVRGVGSVVAAGARIEGGARSLAGYTMTSGGPVISPDMPNDDRFSLTASFVQTGVTSGVSVPIGSSAEPWGVVIAATTSVREFS